MSCLVISAQYLHQCIDQAVHVVLGVNLSDTIERTFPQFRELLAEILAPEDPPSKQCAVDVGDAHARLAEIRNEEYKRIVASPEMTVFLSGYEKIGHFNGADVLSRKPGN